MFFNIDVLKNFAIVTGKHLYWPLQASFYRIPTVAVCEFSLQQILFSAKSVIYCWQSHWFFLRIFLKTRVKPQKQPLEFFCKKRCSYKFCKFHRKTPVLKFFLIELQAFRRRHQRRCSSVEFTKFWKVLRTLNLKSMNDCFWNLFFHLDCPFY